MSEPDQNSKKNTLAKVNNQELFHAPIDPNQQASNAEAGIRPVKNSPGFLLLLLGLIVVGAGAVLMLSQKGLKSAKASPDSDDLGAGISQASGLRGHLVTRWQGKAQYMLKIEPLDPRDAAGFAAVAANPSGPMSINIRLLDSSGFALCGKEIVLRFDPARIRRSNMQLPKSNPMRRDYSLSNRRICSVCPCRRKNGKPARMLFKTSRDRTGPLKHYGHRANFPAPRISTSASTIGTCQLIFRH